jgi:LysM repeat protein
MHQLPSPTPPWLALQPYANARLCLFEVDRPDSREPVPIRRHVIDAFLRQEGVIDGSSDTSLTDPGDVRFSGYLCRAASLPVATRNTFDWLARDLAWSTPGFRDAQPLPWDPALLGTVVAPCEGVIWLGDLALLQPEGVLPNAARAQFAACRVQHFGARYGSGGIGLLLQPLLGEAIELVLSPHRVLVLRPGDTLTLLAGRYGTTVQTLRRYNPQLDSQQTIQTISGDSLTLLAGRHGTTVDTLRRLNPGLRAAAPEITVAGDTLVIVARRCETSVAVLRDYNPDYTRWPQHELLPLGTALLVPAIRPSTLLQPGQALLVPAYLPSTELPAGQWIYLPRGRTTAVPLDAWDTSVPLPPV